MTLTTPGRPRPEKGEGKGEDRGRAMTTGDVRVRAGRRMPFEERGGAGGGEVDYSWKFEIERKKSDSSIN
jgi:hypothetical protein